MAQEPPPTWASGEGVSNERRFAALYAQLRQLAEREVRRNVGGMVSPTTLLHEAYLGMAAGQAAFPDLRHGPATYPPVM